MEKLIQHLAVRQEELEQNNPHEHEWDHAVDDIENGLISAILYYIDGEGESHPNPLKISELLDMLSMFTKKVALVTGEKIEGQQDGIIQYIASLEKGMERDRKLRVVSPENQVQKMGNSKLQIRYKEKKSRRDSAKEFLQQLQSPND